jgi:NADH dehydrogenase FAD-containing subunit
MLAGTYRPQEIRFNVRKMTLDRGAEFIEDTVVRINAEDHEMLLASGSRITYDVSSFNVGSAIPINGMELGGEGIFPVKPIERILAGRQAVLDALAAIPVGKALNLFVAGGGPAGVEMAGGLWRLARDEGARVIITLVAGGRLLDGLPDRVRKLVLRSLTNRGVTVLEGVHARSVAEGQARLDNGSIIPADLAFLAVGVKPSSLFAESGLPTGEDGGLLVNHSLQSVRYPGIFGGGDCVTLKGQPLARVGVYAVRQNPVLLASIAAALEDKPLARFDPGSPDFLLILNMGDGTGTFRKGRWVWQGRLAFRLKDFIDRRFMRKFQLSGELEEEV